MSVIKTGNDSIFTDNHLLISKINFNNSPNLKKKLNEVYSKNSRYIGGFHNGLSREKILPTPTQ